MAGQKILTQVAGVLTEIAAVQAGGGGNANLVPALDASGRLDITMMPTAVVAETVSLVASEALAAGDFVNIYNAAGTPKMRKADATAAGKPAHGFVLAAVSNAATGVAYLEGTNNQVTGMTAGDVFLATTAGAATATCPSGSGNVAQHIGVATSATAIKFTPQDPITLA